jgi:nucleolar protein 56
MAKENSKIVYSNCTGTFVFEGRKLVDSVLFKKQELLMHSKALEKGGQLDTEAAMLKKHAGAEVVGKKDAPPDWVLEFFNNEKQLRSVKEAVMIITKRRMAESLKQDYLIVQAVNNVDEMDKVLNNLAKRLREWYELYNPEFSRSIESDEKFAELIQKKTRKELLNEVGLTQEESMGAEVSKKDLQPVMGLAAEISSLFALRAKQAKYIEDSMKEQMPNVAAVAGAMIGATLLSIAGSMEKMALFPASTIQLLGAEKALFRHIKTGAKPPKFGVIINHPLVTKAKAPEKGRAARMLADKISIAVKLDFFKGKFKGDELRKELDKRLGS